MSDLSGVELIGNGAAFIHQDFARTIVEGFYTSNEILAETINARIQGRTGYDTGALISDETYIINHDSSNEDLVKFFPKSDNQLAVWKRVYVAYQEGGALGKPTYTNAPRLMYASVATQDLPLIEAWGFNVLDNSTNQLAAGIGIPGA